ncbi:MAG TPA: DUF2917 domain-containing protein [Geopsychrobacteraceae bacterium]|nr:DUF2917 domain-containing protein [Geopsychrobacteraceae bacterium]
MELLLNQGELLDLGKNRQGLIIICREGSIWLTQKDDPRDFVLYRGRQFEVRTKGQVVISAVRPSRLQVIPDESAACQNSLALVVLQ